MPDWIGGQEGRWILKAMVCLLALPWSHVASYAGEQKQLVKVLLAVDGVRRNGYEVDVSFVITNRGEVPIFIETDGSRGFQELHSAGVQQLRLGGSWIYVGPFRDTPPESLIELSPGESISDTLHLTDPSLGPRASGPRIRLAGRKHRISVPYYLSKDEWAAFRAYVEHWPHNPGSKPPVEPGIAVSESFIIALPKKGN